MIIRSLLALTLAFAFVGGSASADQHDDYAGRTLTDVTAGVPELGRFSQAFEAWPGGQDLAEGPYTVFAPTDAAFEQAALERGITIDEFLASDELFEWFGYHVVEGRWTEADLRSEIDAAGDMPVTLDTMDGRPVLVSLVDDAIVFDDVAALESPDLEAQDHVVHTIDAFLGTTAATEQIGATPEQFAPVTATDDARNVSTSAAAVPELQRFAAIFAAAPVVEDMAAGPYTVFAPSDEALERAASERGMTIDEFVASPELRDGLGLHVVEGRWTAEELMLEIAAAAGAPLGLQTIDGENLFVEQVGDDLVINDAVTVIAADIEAEGNVIHTVDNVIDDRGL